jgi:hypothetical protein
MVTGYPPLFSSCWWVCWQWRCWSGRGISKPIEKFDHRSADIPHTANTLCREHRPRPSKPLASPDQACLSRAVKLRVAWCNYGSRYTWPCSRHSFGVGAYHARCRSLSEVSRCLSPGQFSSDRVCVRLRALGVTDAVGDARASSSSFEANARRGLRRVRYCW